jgi:hypothetical protein
MAHCTICLRCFYDSGAWLSRNVIFANKATLTDQAGSAARGCRAQGATPTHMHSLAGK